MLIQGLLLLLFYIFVFVLPVVGLIFGTIGIKGVCTNNTDKKHKKYCVYGILSVIYILVILFLPIHTITSYKYSKPDSLLNYFENNFAEFENYSFGYDSIPNDIGFCRLGKKRVQGTKYDGFMIIELEYRKGTLFNNYTNTKFKNIVVYSEEDMINNNPRPDRFREILTTSHENWYFVYVTDNYEYF